MTHQEVCLLLERVGRDLRKAKTELKDQDLDDVLDELGMSETHLHTGLAYLEGAMLVHRKDEEDAR